jgi:hypothetical protein
MAITINTQIQGQQASGICTYGYLYEPLVISVNESDLTAVKLYVDIDVIDTANNLILVETLVQYGEFDINSGQLLSIDLMKLARQHHDAELFKFSHIDEIVESGWSTVVSKYKYRFKIYSDLTLTKAEVFKLPIIGGRLFKDFEATVTESNLLTEAEVVGLDLSDRWCNYAFINTVLVSPTLKDSRPTITSTFNVSAADANTFFVGVDESESSHVAVDESEQTDYIGV